MNYSIKLFYLACLLCISCADAFSSHSVFGKRVVVAATIEVRRQGRNSFVSSHEKIFSETKLNALSQIEDPVLKESIRTTLDKMQVVMEADFFSSKTSGSLKSLYKKMTKVVSVAPSSIPGAGMGLFANFNIKKGTIISFYPAHGMGVDFTDDAAVCVGATVDSEDYFSDRVQKRKDDSANYLHYLIGTRSLAGGVRITDPLFIDVDPNVSDSLGWISHYINDGAIVEENSQSGVLKYYERTKLSKNCVPVPFGPAPIMATVTTKKVKKGEELFTSYGCSYWLEALLLDGEECTDITAPIELEVKKTAQDLFNSMQELQVTYEKEAMQLQSIFETIRV